MCVGQLMFWVGSKGSDPDGLLVNINLVPDMVAETLDDVNDCH